MAATSDNEDQKDGQRDERERKLRQQLRGRSPTAAKFRQLLGDNDDSKEPTRRRSYSTGHDAEANRGGKKIEVRKGPSSDTERQTRKGEKTVAQKKKAGPVTQQAAPRNNRGRQGQPTKDRSPPMGTSPLDARSRNEGPVAINFNFVVRNYSDFFTQLPELARLIRDYDIVLAAAKWKLQENIPGYARFQSVQTRWNDLMQKIRESTMAHIKEVNQASREVQWEESCSDPPRRVIDLNNDRVTLEKVEDIVKQRGGFWQLQSDNIRSRLGTLQQLLKIPADDQIQPDAKWTATVSWKLGPQTAVEPAPLPLGTRQPATTNEGEGDEAYFYENRMSSVNFDEEISKTNGLPVQGIVFIKFRSRRLSGGFVSTRGSGWILNNDTVVTNGHCVVGLDKVATTATIYVGYEEEKEDKKSKKARQVNFKEKLIGKHVIVQWAYFRRFRTRYDIALIKTETKFNAGRVLYWQPTPREAEHQIIVAGYPKPEDDYKPTKMEKSEGRGQAGTDIIEHRLHTLKGSSGSPVLLQGSHTVIGVHRGVGWRERDEETGKWDGHNQAVFLNNTGWNNVNQMDLSLCKVSERVEGEGLLGGLILNEEHDELCELR